MKPRVGEDIADSDFFSVMGSEGKIDAGFCPGHFFRVGLRLVSGGRGDEGIIQGQRLEAEHISRQLCPLGDVALDPADQIAAELFVALPIALREVYIQELRQDLWVIRRVLEDLLVHRGRFL